MTADVLVKLLAIFATIGLGFVAARARWLGSSATATADAARVLGNVTFYLFVPALLFRTMARLDIAALPWRLLAAYFVPAFGFLFACYAALRWRARQAARGTDGAGLPPAGPATRTVAASYGNAVQLGIPMSAALFGEVGLGLHLGLVALHGVLLLTTLTVLVELDLARSADTTSAWATARTTVRNAIVHPVVLPVLAGTAWNLAGLPLPAVLDQTLAGLGAAVVPVCLVLIGVSLAAYGLAGSLKASVAVSVAKLLVLPALVLVIARWGFGLTGVPLAVLVMMGALPVGSNALIFAQRYRVLEAEATSSIVVSTVAFMASAALWLAVLGALDPGLAFAPQR